MKKLGYYPALVVIAFVCLIFASVFFYQSFQTWKNLKQFKSSTDMVKSSEDQLAMEEQKLANNEKADQAYDDYFARWNEKEGQIDETKLKQKLQKMAEDQGLNVFEIVPLDTPDQDSEESKAAKDNSQTSSLALRNLARLKPGMPMLLNRNQPGMIQLKMTLMGPFAQLMTWMERIENEFGSLRVVQTRWVARSPEEVRLTIGFRYKMMGGGK